MLQIIWVLVFEFVSSVGRWQTKFFRSCTTWCSWDQFKYNSGPTIKFYCNVSDNILYFWRYLYRLTCSVSMLNLLLLINFLLFWLSKFLYFALFPFSRNLEQKFGKDGRDLTGASNSSAVVWFAIWSCWILLSWWFLYLSRRLYKCD